MVSQFPLFNYLVNGQHTLLPFFQVDPSLCDSLIDIVECLTLNEEDWGTHDTYLITSGHDQESHLWTSSGLLVGTFGVSSWDLQMKNTWKMKPTDSMQATQQVNKLTQNAVPPPPHRFLISSYLLNCSSPKKSKKDHPKEKHHRVIPTDSVEDHQRAIRLQLHMEVFLFFGLPHHHRNLPRNKQNLMFRSPHVTMISSWSQRYESFFLN
jgi:hypothetical protein